MGDYVTKDGDYVLMNISEEEFRKILDGAPKHKYSEVLNSQSFEEACEVVKRIDPRSWVNNGDRIRDNLRYSFIPKFPEYAPIFANPEPSVTPPACQEWLEVEFTKRSRAKCLFLIGPTRLGKTHWARNLVQPHTYWKSMVNLESWNPESKLLILDDFDDFNFVPNPKGYLTQAGECTVTDKYKKKRTIIVNMPAIYLCNEVPLNKKNVPLTQDNYWSENGSFVYVFERMY